MSRVLLERHYRFCASHLYRRPEWSEEENRARFGRCAQLPGHGHNYSLRVTVAGVPDPATGFVVDLVALDAVVEREVVGVLDHRHVNEALPEFGPGGLVPSGENLVLWIKGRLEKALEEKLELAGVRLAEDAELAAEWRAARTGC